MLADTTANRLYLQLVETALEDSIAFDDEATIPRILASTLGVSVIQHFASQSLVVKN